MINMLFTITKNTSEMKVDADASVTSYLFYLLKEVNQ